VVFDIEGVLIPKNLFIFEIGKSLDPLSLIKVLLIGFLYQVRALTLKSALKRIFLMLQGMEEKRLLEIAHKIALMPQAKEAVDNLKAAGSKIAIISSGLPTSVVNVISQEIEADYAVGFETGTSAGKLTGEIWGDAIEEAGKMKVLRRILKEENLTFANCAVIVDDRNNVSMFNHDLLKIGYNPDFEVRIKADTVVAGTLNNVLPAIAGQPHKRRLPSKNDIRREAIHLGAISIPVLVMLVGLYWVIVLISAVASLYVVSELLRLEGRNLPVFSKITNLAASENELHEFAAAPIYFAVGILLTLIMFPTVEGSAAIAVFAVGDSSASLVGGLSSIRNPINKGKTLGGSIGGLLLAFLAGLLFITPWKALIGAIVAMTIEALPLPINDNITIPISAAIGMTLLP
jgi:HAD superfamily phosphoserine phosphatase-like hydrolase